MLIIALVLSLHASSPVQSRADVPALERQLLLELFAATGGDRWPHRDGWGTSGQVCAWRGVWCDFLDGNINRPVVVGLRLAENNLRGVLQASLGSLQHLQTLDVSRNHLKGVAPEALLRRWAWF